MDLILASPKQQPEISNDGGNTCRPGQHSEENQSISATEKPASETVAPASTFWTRHSLFIRHVQQHRILSIKIHRLWKMLRCSFIDTTAAISDDGHDQRRKCPACQKFVYFQSHYDRAVSTRQTYQECYVVCMDLSLSCLVMAAVLMAWWQQYETKTTTTTATTIFIEWISWQYKVLSEGVQWLESFPIGFKLNESLTEAVGREIQRFLNVHEDTMLWLLRLPRLGDAAALVLIVVALFWGGCGLMAILLDVFRLLTLHLSILSRSTHAVYEFELYLLSALWRLFRGKKRNILRNRTDTMEYDSMQLLLGTILFAISLFLFTTIFVYQVFFSALYMTTLLMVLPLAMVYTVIPCLPWGDLFLRLQRPGCFVCGVYLKEDWEGGKEKIPTQGPLFDVTHLECDLEGYTSLLSKALLPSLGSIISWIVLYFVYGLAGRKPARSFVKSIYY